MDRNLLLQAFLSDDTTEEAKQMLFNKMQGVDSFASPQAPTQESILSTLRSGRDSLRPVSYIEASGIPEFIDTASYFTPGIGDIRSGYDAGESLNTTIQEAKQGNYANAGMGALATALNGIGLIPVIPSLGMGVLGTLKKSDKLLDTAKDGGQTLKTLNELPLNLLVGKSKARNISELPEVIQSEINNNGLLVNPDGSLPKETRNSLYDIYNNLRTNLTKQRSQQERQTLKSFFAENKDLLDNFHKQENINFKTLPVSELQNIPKKSIYKSPSYNSNQSSQYYLGLVDNRPAYIRKSNHWGEFSSNIKLSDLPENQITEAITEQADQFGRLAKNSFNWSLGDKALDSKKSSQAGYVFLDDLPENYLADLLRKKEEKLKELIDSLNR